MAILYKIKANLRQQYLVDPLASRIFRTIGCGSLSRLAVNGNGSCVLGLYRIHYDCDIYETGIHYGPGYQYHSLEKFPVELLRVFSKDPQYLEIVLEYYTKVILREDFTYIHVS